MQREFHFLAWTFLILSFCSFGYELILLNTIVPTTNNDLLSQTLTIGAFIFGLGAGGFLGSRIKAAWTLRIFIAAELALALLGALCPLLIETQHFAYSLLGWKGNTEWLLTSQFLTLALGTLSGLELPLIHRLLKERSEADSWHWLIGFTYLGAFVATLLLPFWLIPVLGVVQVAFLLGNLNFLIAGLFCFQFNQQKILWVLCGGLIFIASLNSQKWQSGLLKLYYTPIQLSAWDAANFHNFKVLLEKTGSIERIVSKYQTIDIAPSARDPEEFILYLNHRIQFHSKTQKFYHEWMSHVALAAFNPNAQRVLVLGGGDGILVNQLLRHTSVESVDLVELDPEMIRLAKTHPRFLKLNEGALSNSRVRVHFADAYSFVRSHRESYDAIFIDLPYPYTFELSRLFSKEFYSAVIKNLSPTGFVCLDFPMQVPLDSGPYTPRDVLQSTLAAAGVSQLFAFGADEAFVAFAANNRPADLAQAFGTSFLSEQTKARLKNLSGYFPTDSDPTLANSVFKPVRFYLERSAL